MTKFPCTPGGKVETDRRKLQRGLVLLAGVVFVVAAVLAIQGVYGSAVLLTLVGLLTAYAARMARDLDLLWVELDPEDVDEGLILQLRRRRLTRPLPLMARELTEEEIQHVTQLTRWSGFQVATGGYESRLLGEVELYTNNLKQPVLLKLPEEVLIVTPDDASALVAAVDSIRRIDLWPG